MELITVVAIAMTLVLLLGAGLFGGYIWYWIVAAVSVVAFHVYFRPLRRVEVQQTSSTASEDVSPHFARPHTETTTATPRPPAKKIVAATTESGESTMQYPITLIAALAALGTLLATPILFLLGFDQITIRGLAVSLVTIGLIAMVVDVVSNILSGLTKQSNPELNGLDKWMSRFRTLSVVLTAIAVGVLFYNGDPTVTRVMDTPNAWTLLGLLVFWGLFDVFVIQRLKDKGLVSFEARQAAAPAHGQGAGFAHEVNPADYPEGHAPQVIPSRTGLANYQTPFFVDILPVFRWRVPGNGFVVLNPDDVPSRIHDRVIEYRRDEVTRLAQQSAQTVAPGVTIDHEATAEAPQTAAHQEPPARSASVPQVAPAIAAASGDRDAPDGVVAQPA